MNLRLTSPTIFQQWRMQLSANKKDDLYWATSRVSSLSWRTHQAVILCNWLWCFRMNYVALDAEVLTWLYLPIAPISLKMPLVNQYSPTHSWRHKHLPPRQHSELMCNFSTEVWLKHFFFFLFLHPGVGDWTCALWMSNNSVCLCTVCICVQYMHVYTKYFLQHSANLEQQIPASSIAFKMGSACCAFPLSGNLCWPYWGCWKEYWFRMKSSFVSVSFEASGNLEHHQWIEIVRLLKVQICTGLKLCIYGYVRRQQWPLWRT